jgi:hypothetical protein
MDTMMVQEAKALLILVIIAHTLAELQLPLYGECIVKCGSPKTRMIKANPNHRASLLIASVEMTSGQSLRVKRAIKDQPGKQDYCGGGISRVGLSSNINVTTVWSLTTSK